VRTRLIVLTLGCCLVLIGGCTQAAEESSGPVLETTFASPKLTSMLPSLDSSASMDVLVSSIAARKAAEEARVRAIAQAKARKRAALAARRAQAARTAARRTSSRTYTAPSTTWTPPTEAEKAAAARARALKKAQENMPDFTP